MLRWALCLCVLGVCVARAWAGPADPSPSEQGKALTNTVGMDLVPIPAGNFLMGSPKGEAGRQDNEAQKRVEIARAFRLAATPVTQTQWNAVMGKAPSPFAGDDRPVVKVSWDDAQKFCRTLGDKEGRKYRLPTEAEWEYACRAGTATAYNTGDTEKSLAEAGWYSGNCKTRQAVSLKKANAWGLYDMHGNVMEWTQDKYDDVSRVLRGGSWADGPQDCRSASRAKGAPRAQTDRIGFRVVLESPDPLVKQLPITTPPGSGFNLTSMAKLDANTGQMRVRNPSDKDQPFTLSQYGTAVVFTGVAPANQDTFVAVPWTASNNTWLLSIAGKKFVKAVGHNPIAGEGRAEAR